MALGGLGLKALQQKLQKPTRQCDRCGLRTPLDKEQCVHCADLDERGLEALMEKVQWEREGVRNLGVLFLGLGALSGLIVLTLFI